MDEQMFCFQCEQAAGCTACTGAAGVCGKSAETAAAQDRLTGALIAFAGQLIAAGRGPAPEQARLLMQGLFTTITNVNFDPAAVDALTRRVHDASPGTGPDYDMQALWREPDADRRSLKCFVLFSLRGMAAYNYHARVLGRIDPELDRFFCTALQAVGDPGQTTDALWQLVQATGEASYRCMELLDAANTGAFGDPEPVQVPLTIEKGPFIVISGHDLYDAQQLLEQTAGRGVNVYTHSEMLPAHGYPELKRRYPHLKGNFGTAWQNQQREFEDIPAPILFTTNCIMPLRASYADRVFTTSVVAYPGVPHIDEGRDFSPVIEKALELGGYAQDTLLPGLNGGSTVTTGFARTAVLQHADEIVQAVRDGKLRHFFLVGGCDGTRPSRRYYTEFARLTPPDTILLTLACGKFRLNDLPLGTVPGTGLPRILDVGQCNDAYSAIRIALALADAFGCGVNDLPLSLVLCWFEQLSNRYSVLLQTYQYAAKSLGNFILDLKDKGWLKNTIVAATGDHNARMNYQSEGNWHHVYGVPVLFWLPDQQLKSSADSDRWVSHRDIIPTLLAMSTGKILGNEKGRNLFAKDIEEGAVSFIGWSGAGFVIGKPGMVTLNGKNLECYNWQDDKLIKADRCSKEQEKMGKEARAQRAISEYIVRKGLAE